MFETYERSSNFHLETPLLTHVDGLMHQPGPVCGF